MVSDATESGRTYVIDRVDGRREILYGVSVYAQPRGQDVAEVLHRFSRAPCYVAVTVADLRPAGLEVIATGTNPDHFDVQLVTGRFDDDTEDDPEDELRGAAARFLWAASNPISNPAYAGDPEEER